MCGVGNPPVRHDQRYKRNSILVLNLASRMQTASARGRHQDRTAPHLYFSSILVLNLASLIHGRICGRLPTGVCGLSGCNLVPGTTSLQPTRLDSKRQLESTSRQFVKDRGRSKQSEQRRRQFIPARVLSLQNLRKAVQASQLYEVTVTEKSCEDRIDAMKTNNIISGPTRMRKWILFRNFFTILSNYTGGSNRSAACFPL
ncbi:Hypothetical_protein [Hexamita inflata]|uniref:Hypothetical_protein n=1 Tax=Hexamita inflata TaxID=28002 RepID=A0AA86NRA5_9EUKA|nr:Hypothetical protein HINF_LOCUS12088 [Hexamita inflata]